MDTKKVKPGQSFLIYGDFRNEVRNKKKDRILDGKNATQTDGEEECVNGSGQ